MPHFALRLEQIGKWYRRAPGSRRHETMRDQWVASTSSAWRRVTGRATGIGEPAAAQGFWALRDITLDIGAGEILGVVGHNGSGKSTLLKILARITAPTAGRIMGRGKVAAMLEVGTGFHHELSGRENVFLSGAILGLRREEIRRRFDSIVKMAGVGEFLDVPVKRYSTGMHLRLAFSVAAHVESEILLLDEVLAVGDAGFQRMSLAHVRQQADRGRTVVIVSHDRQALAAVCDRVLLLEAGGVKALGATDEVLRPERTAA